MEYSKPRRTRNEALLATFRAYPCAACSAPPPSHAHHIQSRGSGGHDVPTNLMPLCVHCHHLIHLVGLVGMIQGSQRLRAFLIMTGRGEMVMRAMEGKE